MAIRLLENHVAELIAAGEVVERPASVVKEMLENAIDAGAKNISVEIERGGIALMRIQDNGSGIAAEEIPLAFLRHATSKISSESDLNAIRTLGFRGEALASIASVSRVELLTATKEAEFASLYRVAGGVEQGLEAAARPVGTSITVRDLFYNTPARMKFLKKDASEGTYVTETVTRLAFSHPEVAFRYAKDGKQVFATPGDGKLESVVYTVLGKEFASGLIPVSHQAKHYRVSGLVSMPYAARASRSMQFFYINGRFVKNRTMMAAMEQAYRGRMMHGRFPGGILLLRMPPELVDVNVHPAKTEVRFARENEIFDLVYQAVKTAVLATSDKHRELALPGQKPTETAEPPLFESEKISSTQVENAAEEPLLPAPHRQNTVAGEALASEAAPYQTMARTNPLAQQKSHEWGLDIEGPDPFVQADATFPHPQNRSLPEQVSLLGKEAQPALHYVGEIFGTYILAQGQASLCLLDKHAAHERMLYEKIADAREAPVAQQLLQPAHVLLSAEEKIALLAGIDVLKQVGIELEDFGGNSVLVRSVPSDIEPQNVENLLEELAQRLSINAKDTTDEKSEWVMHSIACRAAVKAGDKNDPSELLLLAEDILSGRVPPYCPHGRPVVLEISRKELEKQFGRLG